jgi:AraC-like DNA-binding protein
MHIVNDSNDFSQFLDELHKEIGGSLHDGIYEFPAHVADGYLQHLSLGNQTSLMLANYRQKIDINHFRLSSLPEIFVLRIHFFKNSGTIEVEIDESTLTDKSANYAGMVLTSSTQNMRYLLPAGTIVKTAHILFTPQKLYSYFPGYDMQKIVRQYLMKKTLRYNMIPMNFNSRQAFAESLELKRDDPFYMLSLQTRMLEIADYFFEKLIEKKDEKPLSAQTLEEFEKISELDLNWMDKLDQAIPSAEELAEQVFMSPSKFKILFKQLYGEAVYDYFYTGRLNVARRQIMQGTTSIKEVAFLMGFKTTAQFSAAFKKNFGFSPTDIKLQTIDN